MFTYTEADYASSRLDGTCIRDSQGNLIYVHHVGGSRTVSCFDIKSLESKSLRLSDLDATPIPLGMAQVSEHAYFLHRKPVRRYRQGISWDNLSGYTGPALPRDHSAYRILLQPVENVYPNWETALLMLEDRYKTVAISRNFALTDKGLVLYRQTKDSQCGKLTKSNRVSLDPSFEFVKELFQLEVGEGVLNA
jgi:hypothetical protein